MNKALEFAKQYANPPIDEVVQYVLGADAAKDSEAFLSLKKDLEAWVKQYKKSI